MSTPSAEQSLEMARRHLEKVRDAWLEPTDWSDLSLYGFYCLEAAVVAGTTHMGIPVQRTHPSKVAASQTLRANHGLPDITQLLVDLNIARKAAAYGDLDMPDLNAEQLVVAIERYVDAVADLTGL
jgi:hypothetical protein